MPPSHLPALCGTKMAAPQMSPKFCHWRSCAARTRGDIFSLARTDSGDNWQCADGAEVSGLRLFCSIVTEMSTNRNSRDMSPLPAQCSSRESYLLAQKANARWWRGWQRKKGANWCWFRQTFFIGRSLSGQPVEVIHSGLENSENIPMLNRNTKNMALPPKKGWNQEWF